METQKFDKLQKIDEEYAQLHNQYEPTKVFTFLLEPNYNSVSITKTVYPDKSLVPIVSIDGRVYQYSTVAYREWFNVSLLDADGVENQIGDFVRDLIEKVDTYAVNWDLLRAPDEIFYGCPIEKKYRDFIEKFQTVLETIETSDKFLPSEGIESYKVLLEKLS